MKNNMVKNITKTLAIIGTLLVALPIVAPFFFSIIFLLRSGQVHFDYLMPAELFLLVLVGGGLLLWAAIRAGSQLKMISWSYGLAIFLLVASQALAVVTGLASGKIEMTSPWMVVVLGGIISYTLMVLLLIFGGFLLIRHITSSLRSNDHEK